MNDATVIETEVLTRLNVLRVMLPKVEEAILANSKRLRVHLVESV